LHRDTNRCKNVLLLTKDIIPHAVMRAVLFNTDHLRASSGMGWKASQRMQHACEQHSPQFGGAAIAVAAKASVTIAVTNLKFMMMI
jgi:hypothetical protein